MTDPINYILRLIFYVALVSCGALVVIGIAYLWRSIASGWWPRGNPFGQGKRNDYYPRGKEPTVESERQTSAIRDLVRHLVQQEIRSVQRSIESIGTAQNDNFRRMDKRVRDIEKELAQIRRTGQKGYIFTGQSRESTQPLPNTHTSRLSESSTCSATNVPPDLLRFYHAGVDDARDRDAFQARYRPIRIRTTNSMQRRKDPRIPPEFQSSSDGDYYAVALEGQTQGRFAVMPGFDLTLGEATFTTLGMGSVFDYPNFDPRLKYRHVKVKRPAIFESDGEQNWRLIEVGELDLGAGE